MQSSRCSVKEIGEVLLKQVVLIVLFASILTVSESMGQKENTYLRGSKPEDWKRTFFSVIKEEYPQLPYEKFKMYDPESVKMIEVFVNPKAARGVYRMIQQQMKTSEKEVFVEGTISGFDMPVMGQCYRGIRVELEKSEDMKFR
jgi:hypothetical protein